MWNISVISPSEEASPGGVPFPSVELPAVGLTEVELAGVALPSAALAGVGLPGVEPFASPTTRSIRPKVRA